jgi:hypothetical protein
MRNNGRVANARGITQIALAVALVLVAGLIVAVEPLHGSIVLTVMPNHGLDSGDLIVLPLLLLAGWLVGSGVRREAADGRENRVRGAASTVCLGASLVAIGSLRLADVTQRGGPIAFVLALLLGGTALWFVAEIVLGEGPWLDGLTGRGWLLCTVLLVGSLIDLLFVPSGTVFGVAALALCVALFVRSRGLRVAMLVLAMAFLMFNVASLSDLARIDEVMSGDNGAAARSTALGLVLIAIGIAAWRQPTRPRPT